MWTLGVLIGIPVTLIILGVCGFLMWTSKRIINEERGHTRFNVNPDRLSTARAVWWGSLATIVATVLLFVGLMWPLDPTYHRWNAVEGTVQQNERRLMAQTDYFVITFVGNPQPYRCDDSRCALANVGQELRLLCKPEFDYAAVDGWGCRYGQPGGA